ncbi:MAG: class I SAM-dependent methyltransferase [Myxococcota bacterium]
MKPEAYDRIYQNPILTELAALGPHELTDPRVAGLSNGFLVVEDLERLVTHLAPALSSTEAQPPWLLDLGCGRGSLGRRLATRLSARLVGVDGSPIAIEQAIKQATAVRSDRPDDRFVVGDFASTGLADGSVDAALSHDALYMSEQPRAALVEIGRVLRTGGLLTFTAYSSVPTAWEALARSLDWSVEHIEDLTEPWRRIMRAKHERRWAHRHALRDRFGQRVEPELSVTRSMLGLGGRPAAVDRIERRAILLRRA